MVLSNAERQRRFRERQKHRVDSVGGLTAEQIFDRDAVAADPIWPVPRDRSQIPRFLGWSRYDWSVAPRELVEHVGLVDAWEGWKAETEAMEAEQRRINEATRARAAEIIAECGDKAKEVAAQYGLNRMFRDYEAGLFKLKRVKRVT